MPRISAIIVSACLSGCVAARLFVVADTSARAQLQQAVMASRVQPKPNVEVSRAKLRSLDKQRLATTIAMVGREGVE